MLFVEAPKNANGIRALCARFSEGIRVEYKSTLDENVRRNLPKVLSSFANSLGGVLVIGVETQNGVPQEPTQGFPTPAEEIHSDFFNNHACLRQMTSTKHTAICKKMVKSAGNRPSV